MLEGDNKDEVGPDSGFEDSVPTSCSGTPTDGHSQAGNVEFGYGDEFADLQYRNDATPAAAATPSRGFLGIYNASGPAPASGPALAGRHSMGFSGLGQAGHMTGVPELWQAPALGAPPALGSGLVPGSISGSWSVPASGPAFAGGHLVGFSGLGQADHIMSVPDLSQFSAPGAPPTSGPGLVPGSITGSRPVCALGPAPEGFGTALAGSLAMGSACDSCALGKTPVPASRPGSGLAGRSSTLGAAPVVGPRATGPVIMCPGESDWGTVPGACPEADCAGDGFSLGTTPAGSPTMALPGEIFAAGTPLGATLATDAPDDSDVLSPLATRGHTIPRGAWKKRNIVDAGRTVT